MNTQHVLWAIAGAAVAYVLLQRRRANQDAKTANVAAGEALLKASTDALVDDGPDSELGPCCSKCAGKTSTAPIFDTSVPEVSLTAPAPATATQTTVRTGYRLPRGPIKIYMGGGGRARPSSGAIITQKLGSGGTVR